jgi:hypothetical protein
VGGPRPPSKTPAKSVVAAEGDEQQPASDEGLRRERECLAALGSEHARLLVAISAEELKSFALDHTSGFLLSLLDGATSLEDVLDIAGVPRLVALHHLRQLMEQGIIASASDVTPAPESGPGSLTLDAVPVLRVAREALDRMELEPRARLLLAFVDEKTTVEEILARARFDFVDGMLLLEQLAADGVLAFA